MSGGRRPATVIRPSALLIPTTETIGYFETDALTLAGWLASALRSPKLPRKVRPTPLRELIDGLLPLGERTRHLLLPGGAWTALLNNSRLGTDLGVLPLHAVHELGCRAIRAVAAGDLDGKYPATALDVFDPSVEWESLHQRRALWAGNDGGSWSFDDIGERYDFEEPETYRQRRVRDRFTQAMLDRYLDALGIPPASDFDERIIGAYYVVKR